jgi:hypothetical protein
MIAGGGNGQRFRILYCTVLYQSTVLLILFTNGWPSPRDWKMIIPGFDEATGNASRGERLCRHWSSLSFSGDKLYYLRAFGHPLAIIIIVVMDEYEPTWTFSRPFTVRFCLQWSLSVVKGFMEKKEIKVNSPEVFPKITNRKMRFPSTFDI